MQRMFLKMIVCSLFVSSACYGQSLGDVARANRERAAEDAAIAPPIVITTADFPPNTHTNPEPGVSQQQRNSDADHRSAQRRLAEQRAREQWRRQILEQKQKVLSLQARIDQLHASIRAANGSVQFEGPSNGYQARQLQHVAQIQHQLEVQKVKLEQMQEAARHAGMHTAVYDP